MNFLNQVGVKVQVRDLEEILSTLDENGCLDGLPFMPEMAAYCGKTVKIAKRADKVIDMVKKTGLRRMSRTVTLQDLRCDGHRHGGCQSGCQILWKEDWLRVPRGDSTSCDLWTSPDAVKMTQKFSQCKSTLVQNPIRPIDSSEEEIYCCQATELFDASSDLAWWDIRQDLAPLWFGNISLKDFIYGTLIALFNAVQRFRGGCDYPYIKPANQGQTPCVELGLKCGELVRVKTITEIEKTLDKRGRNRGLWFDKEMVRYCGGCFRVLRRVERAIDEKSGRLVKLRNPCVILDGVTAKGHFHRFNPQDEYIFWREIWLERISSET